MGNLGKKYLGKISVDPDVKVNIDRNSCDECWP